MRIHPRSEWTTEPKGFDRRLDPAKVYFVAIHYPADRGLQPPYDGISLTIEQVKQRFRAYRRFHTMSEKLGGRGWDDIGYPFAVDQAGRAWELAGERVAAHSATPSFKDANQKGLAILLLIGNNEEPTQACINTVNALIGHFKTKYPGIRTIYPHRGVPGASTQCPGDRAARLVSNGIFNLKGKAPYSVEYITEIQELLNQAGYAVLIDGIFGSETRTAVEFFQAAEGLFIDGDPGPITLEKLREKADTNVAKFIQGSTNKIFMTDGIQKVHIPNPEVLAELTRVFGGQVHRVSDATLNTLPTLASVNEIREAVKEVVSSTTLPIGGAMTETPEQVADLVVGKIAESLRR